MSAYLDLLSIAMVIIAVALAASAIGYLMGWNAHERVDDRDALHLPIFGRLHFHDGLIRPVYADSPAHAIGRLIAQSKQVAP